MASWNPQNPTSAKLRPLSPVDGVAKAAHKLKSSARSVGANELADLCQTLEEAGNAEDWDKIDNAAPRLAGVMQQVTEYIKAL